MYRGHGQCCSRGGVYGGGGYLPPLPAAPRGPDREDSEVDFLQSYKTAIEIQDLVEKMNPFSVFALTRGYTTFNPVSLGLFACGAICLGMVVFLTVSGRSPAPLRRRRRRRRPSRRR